MKKSKTCTREAFENQKKFSKKLLILEIFLLERIERIIKENKNLPSIDKIFFMSVAVFHKKNPGFLY